MTCLVYIKDYDTSTHQYTSMKNVTNSSDTVWTRYVFNTGEVGITAAKCVMNKSDNGKVLLGVMEIDYTLGELSEFLKNTNDNNDSLSWVFEANQDEPDMVASSDDQVLQPAKDLDGLTCYSGSDPNSTLIAYDATDHPRYEISVLSQLIIDVSKIQSLPTTKGESKTIRTTIDLPYVEASRVLIDNNGTNDNGIDWVIVKSIDISDTKEKIRDSKIVAGVITAMIGIVMLFLFNRLNNVVDIATSVTNYVHPQRTPADVKDVWDDIIHDAASVEWNNKFGNCKRRKLITVDDAISFSCKKAIYYISKIENTFFLNDQMMLCDECCFIIENVYSGNIALKLLVNIVSWEVYNNYFVELIIVLHIASAFWEPTTQKLLEEKGWQPWLIVFAAICILIEWMDLFIQCYTRFVRFRTRTSINSKNKGYVEKCQKIEMGTETNSINKRSLNSFKLFYETQSDILKIFIGIGAVQFNCLLVTNILVLTQFIMATVFRSGVFSYYIPIVPLLLICRHNSFYLAAKNCLFALEYATNALLLCFTMLIVCACFGVAIFEKSLNSDATTNNFSDIGFAIVSIFVFITTGENYNDLVNTELDTQYTSNYYKIYFFIIIIINLFCFIPALIERFEKAYGVVNQMRHKRKRETRITAIIASFIMLDIDENQLLSKNQFDRLFRWKDLTSFYIYLSKTQKCDSADLSLDNYINAILTKRLSFNIDDNIVVSNRWQAYVECKIIRNPWFGWCSLIVGIFPAMLGGLLNGVSMANISPLLLKVLFYWTFMYNTIEIAIKIWAFGNIGWFKFRYFNLIKYEDPPFVQWCTFNNMQKNMTRSLSGASIAKKSSYTKVKNSQLSSPLLQKSVSESDDDCDEKNKYTPPALRYLTYEDWVWCEENLTKNFIAGDNSTIWTRKREIVANWFDFVVVAFSILGVLYHVIVDDYYDSTIFLQLPLLRLFTLIESNLQIGFEIIMVANKSFAVIMVAILYLFIWARIGVSLFYQKTDVVLTDYDSDVTFDSLHEGISTLVQIMIGEAWDEIMHVNVLATGDIYCIYFVIYVLIITLFIVNIVTGLILAGMDSVKKQMMQASIEAQNAMRYRGTISTSVNKLETWRMKNRVFSVSLLNS